MSPAGEGGDGEEQQHLVTAQVNLFRNLSIQTLPLKRIEFFLLRMSRWRANAFATALQHNDVRILM